MKLYSPAFKDCEVMPVKYTCEGENISPPLRWKDLPKGTKTLALVVEDPDAPDPKAPKTTWDHWVVYNVPSDINELREDYGDLPVGSHQGINSWKKIGYGGPCPPIGKHRYIFKMYALDDYLEDLGKPSKLRLLKAIEGHVLAQAQLTGLYEKKAAA
ncbi:MAG: YbhB/YbcL family Raf kinase inhibitor-like protein [Bacteriovoracaceae bacterium]|nr:YbhB/YbcL family Raf kinase inhibitor-like protein [Bacteriovoracaceae bacterium]